MTTNRPLTGREALVTGASRRVAIGQAVVRRLVADGAAVLVHSWSPHDVERATATARTPTCWTSYVHRAPRSRNVGADLADPDAPARLVAAAREAFGLTYAVNTRATLLLVKRARRAPRRPARGTCAVVHLRPVSRRHARRAALHRLQSRPPRTHRQPRRTPHAPRDHGQLREPGPNNTGYGDEHLWKIVEDRNPGGGGSTPHDAARLVGWLVSDQAEWITGQTSLRRRLVNARSMTHPNGRHSEPATHRKRCRRGRSTGTGFAS